MITWKWMPHMIYDVEKLSFLAPSVVTNSKSQGRTSRCPKSQAGGEIHFDTTFKDKSLQCDANLTQYCRKVSVPLRFLHLHGGRSAPSPHSRHFLSAPGLLIDMLFNRSLLEKPIHRDADKPAKNAGVGFPMPH